MEEAYYRQLVKRYLEKQISDDELEVFAHLLNEGKLDEHLAEAMSKDALAFETSSAGSEDIPSITRKKRYWPTFAAAASILLCLSVGFYFYRQSPKQNLVNNNVVKNDFLPGSNKAVLTLANGSKLSLTGGNKGLLAHQGITAINKKEEGRVEYRPGTDDLAAGQAAATLYNTVSTPKGGQYQVVLPDGTRVWLNTASSIRFPTAFTGNDRQVEISGEVYFEVAKNKSKPFIVSSGNQKVTVLGTHFDINAYQDEGTVKTTLLEGSVKVTNGDNMVLLKPGQQSQLSTENKLTVSNDIDMDEVVAWKNGFFQFNKADIQTIMNQISRWYDVEVRYEGQVQPGHYYGKISRNVNASKVLKVLELSGMHFIIEGGKIIVK
ncbi:FecR family protein [Mucilaginibacter rubeus]|uniref:FecR family protein n=1 Tax=Mucilaginibacter rubeus TaxID=2027860 RepID=A0A5C1I054_9SPHI|nr:FecR family protein [Mucilaginibacter rubeus]QEM11396.1 FecR family protein [Mucilaginibacter rubeus]